MSVQQFQQYFDLDLVGMARLDRNGNYLQVNDYLCRMTGRSREEMIGTPVWDLSTKEDSLVEQEMLAQICQKQRDHYRLNKKIVCKKSDRYAEMAVRAIYDEPGEIDHFIVIATDTTKREEAVKKLIRQQQQLESLIEQRRHELDILRKELADLYQNAPVMYFTLAPEDGRLLQYNTAFAEKTRLDQQLSEGGSIFTYYHPGCHRQVAQLHRILETKPHIAGKEVRVVLRCGEILDVSLFATAVRDTQGTLVQIRCCWIDITEQKQSHDKLHELAAALETSNTDLEHFAYIISHDLQEPLRIIASYTYLLGDRYREKLDARAEKYITYAVDGAERMQRMIQDLLRYSRINSQAKELVAIKSGKALELALQNLAILIAESKAVIEHDTLPAVLGDQSQLVQLFQNLIANAIKFCGDKTPQIFLRVKKSGERWVFALMDNGIGIREEYQEKVFVVFQRLHSRKEYDGTGIGLAICKRIIERHGGKIWFTSSPGKGTVFYFTLAGIQE